MKRSTVVTLAAIAAIAGLAIYSTTSQAGHRCQVCVTYHGRSNCAAAAGTTEQDAKEGAQTTACGMLASGMDQSIACGRVQPDSVQCRTR
ncbi:MAG TPA: hypothetical protein VIW26_16720 [Gemmatimonadales bacterium]